MICLYQKKIILPPTNTYMSILLSFRGLLDVTNCKRYDWSVDVMYACKDEDCSIEGRDVIEIEG